MRVNLIEGYIYKSTVIKNIDTNIGQLLKTDAKFYAIDVSPSENELRVMGNTEQEKAEAMKCYIRKVFIPEYAKNFNKELSEADTKFYGKIHFSSLSSTLDFLTPNATNKEVISMKRKKQKPKQGFRK